MSHLETAIIGLILGAIAGVWLCHVSHEAIKAEAYEYYQGRYGNRIGQEGRR